MSRRARRAGERGARVASPCAGHAPWGLALLLLLPTSACKRAEAPVAQPAPAPAVVAQAPVVPPPDLRLVRTPQTPVFDEAEDDAAAIQHLDVGTVVLVRRSLGQRSWRGDAVAAARRGELLEGRRSRDDGSVFVFADDLEPAPEGPPLALLCEAGDAACVGALRTVARPDGGWFGYVPCAGPGCLLASLSPGQPVARRRVDGLIQLAWLAPDVVVVEQRWVKAPTWTGSAFVVLDLPGLQERQSVLADEVLVDGGVALRREVQWTVDGGVLWLHGAHSVQRTDTGRVLQQTAFDERHPLGATP